MSGRIDNQHNEHGALLSCTKCRAGMQEYVDGTLDKDLSLQFFMHLRECASCEYEHTALREMFALLADLPAHEAPADFDRAILAAVPYASYKAMAGLRRDRVPVFLEEAFLPRVLRSRVTRWSGLGLSLVATLGAVTRADSVGWLVMAAVGLMPEVLVLLQIGGRRVADILKAGS